VSERSTCGAAISHRTIRAPSGLGPTCPRNPRWKGSFQQCRTRSTWAPRAPFHSWRRRTAAHQNQDQGHGFQGGAGEGDPTVIGRPSHPVHLARPTGHVTQWNPFFLRSVTQWNPMRQAPRSYKEHLVETVLTQLNPRFVVLQGLNRDIVKCRHTNGRVLNPKSASRFPAFRSRFPASFRSPYQTAREPPRQRSLASFRSTEPSSSVLRKQDDPPAAAASLHYKLRRPLPFPPISSVSKIRNGNFFSLPPPSPMDSSSSVEAAAVSGGYGCSGWETPKREECRIPATLPCPAAPRKAVLDLGKRRTPPKNGYFQPPDLEALFALAPRRQASSCA
jgi:hypothetical protein